MDDPSGDPIRLVGIAYSDDNAARDGTGLFMEEGERMLVLSRGLKQSIVINGGEVTVTVLEIKDGRVRLGIEADPKIPVVRTEIQETGSKS